MTEKALQYINGVRDGKIPSCRWIRLAVERHFRDLERTDWGFYFDEGEAARVLGLFNLFRFSKGEHSGRPFDIMPWFAAIVYMAYGWRREGGGRRFRKVYCKVPRGNAKTANLVNIATIGFLFDGQGDAEVYWLAMNKEQAKIGWDRQREMLQLMVDDYPELSEILYIPEGKTSSRITTKQGLSWVSYIGQDSKGRDGLNPFYIVCDEYHEWPNDDLMNKMESGMVKVTDPVTWIITTAGYLPNGPNSQFLKSCKNTLEGVVDNDELLAFIYEMDEGDDWKDEAVWAKLNPGIGISLTIESLRTEFNKIAAQGIAKEIDFRVKNLNEEHSSKQGWIADADWVACAGHIDWTDLRERDCWAGLDLANTQDFNAFVLFFPPKFPGDKCVIVPYFWTPESNIEETKRNRPFLLQWANEGHLNATTGNATDYEKIRKDINAVCKNLRVQAIAYDRKLSSYLSPRLSEDGFRMEIYMQSWGNLGPPAQYFERMAVTREILHDGNPVARWMLSNIVLRFDANQNHLPSKGASADKIDFVAATLNAIGQWLIDRGIPNVGSYLFEEDSEVLIV